MEHPAGEAKPICVPYPLALILCDLVIAERGTNKHSLIGIFSTIFAPTFPVRHDLMVVYLALTDVRGEIPLRLVLVDVNEEREPIFSVTGRVSGEDPRATSEVIFYFRNITFPSQGEYRLKVYAGNDFLVERRILVLPIPKPETKK
ncbi:MAG: hypothetical protein HYU36_25530 [Planctomycetes bacterium]|nr:hypothetical protein [Planctomycetota bacterium]